MYDFSLPEVASFIERRKAKLVALQFPEGLLSHAKEVIEELERRTGARFLVLADPCYGACDVNLDYRKYADALVHFGHTEMPSLGIDEGALYVEVKAEVDILSLLPEAEKKLAHRVGLITTVQHLGSISAVSDALVRDGFETKVGKGDGRIKHPGQVLGCNVSAAKEVEPLVDCFLFIGSGDFHPLAVAIGTGKPVLVLDPYMRSVHGIEELREKILRQRHGAIARAEGANSFGILVSTKPGQKRMELAERLRTLAQSKGKTTVILVANNIDPERLLVFDVDAFVSTACPRLAIDDYMRYRKPILTPPEFEVLLGERKWDEYVFDAIAG
ncbi:MAG: diphthamide biosynthesis enzyme Dph2 [Methanomassiliicoccales archaeon]|nr:diphthamide biosynthesis enzyme Dph2 [Methanomassiliicoccales archaeon]